MLSPFERVYLKMSPKKVISLQKFTKNCANLTKNKLILTKLFKNNNSPTPPKTRVNKASLEFGCLGSLSAATLDLREICVS